MCTLFNTLRPIQNFRYFTDNIFKCVLLNENVWILLKISLKFVPKFRINNIPALVLIMVWRQPGDKSLSVLMMVSLMTQMCILNDLKGKFCTLYLRHHSFTSKVSMTIFPKQTLHRSDVTTLRLLWDYTTMALIAYAISRYCSAYSRSPGQLHAMRDATKKLCLTTAIIEIYMQDVVATPALLGQFGIGSTCCIGLCNRAKSPWYLAFVLSQL